MGLGAHPHLNELHMQGLYFQISLHLEVLEEVRTSTYEFEVGRNSTYQFPLVQVSLSTNTFKKIFPYKREKISKKRANYSDN